MISISCQVQIKMCVPGVMEESPCYRGTAALARAVLGKQTLKTQIQNLPFGLGHQASAFVYRTQTVQVAAVTAWHIEGKKAEVHCRSFKLELTMAHA